MRRFELTEGSSNKFWSIDVSGETFKVIYGRIGTDGREQTKTFDSDEVAGREADKMIRAKTKKGYIEVGAADAAASGSVAKPAAKSATKKKPTKNATTKKKRSSVDKAPAAQTAEAPAAAAASLADYSKPFLDWTDDLKKRISPHRGMEAPARGKATIKAASLFKKGVAALAKDAARWAAGELAADAAGKALMVRVRARLGGEEPTELDVDLEAGCIHVTIAYEDWSTRGKLLERALYFWEQEYGALGAAKALVRSTEMRLITRNAEHKSAPHLYLPQTPEKLNGHWPEAWAALRHIMAFALPDEYEQTRAWLRAWALGFESDAPAYTSTAFVLSEDADMRAAVLEKTPGFWGAAALPTNAEEAAPVFVSFQRPNLYKHLQTLIWRVGIDVLPLLLANKPDSYDLEVARGWVRALSVFAGLEPARAMATFIEAKSVRPILADYFERHPALGLAVLPEVIAATKKKAPREAAKAMLANLEAAAEAPSAEELGPIVSVDSLPPVLQSPPWRSKRKGVSAASFDLKPLELPAELALSESERTELSKQARSSSPTVPAQQQIDGFIDGTGRANIWEVVRIKDDDIVMKCVIAISAADRWRWNYGEMVRGVIARLGPAIAPHVVPMITQPEVALALVDLGTPLVAPLMAAAAFRAKTKREARAWLSRFPEHAATGLIPDAFGSDKKLRKTATAALRLLVQSGQGDVIKSVGAKYGDEVSKATDALVEMNPLLDAPTKPPKIPDWVDLERLPRPRLKTGEVLSEDHTKYLIEMLIFSEVDPPYEGIAQVSVLLDPESANEFARGLCSGWAAAGAKPVWKWAAHSLGHLGNDESARWLVGQINAWASDGSKSVSVAGLEALGMIGSNVALMPLAHWSRRGKPWLKTGAQQVLEDIAAHRNLSPDELEDQTAPTLGLDEKGGLTLDYGPRQFFVTFDEQLHPRIHDEAGERVAKIPPARKTDDTALAKAAKKTWATLKKDAESLSKGQVDRLERAMTMTRSWSVEEFETHLVRHPLVGHLVRRLVFAHDHSDALSTFRVGEDLSYADAADDDFTLHAEARIRILHPVSVSEQELAQWGSLFADYEILQPFAQLGRTVHRPTPADVGTRALARAAGIAAYTGRIFALKTRGWVLTGDPYSMDGATKELGFGLSASISWDDGIELERPKMQEHNIRHVRVHGDLTLDQLDPLVFSELVTDVESLRRD